jgi:hypothetical protein
MRDTNVIPFQQPNPSKTTIERGAGTTTKDWGAQGVAAVDLRRTEGSSALTAMPIEVLWQATADNLDEIAQALVMLQECIAELEAARATFSGDRMLSDSHVQLAESFLPRLFRFRSLGDGYLTLINALEVACVNRRGEPLDLDQINAAIRLLKSVKSHPFLSADQAQDSVDELESVRLMPYPATLATLLDAER